ncbi:hypothetical protein PHYBLDRAFT_65322 [Phycomyces blakesleeanus NRRL 1555(-)]|uniref:Uncharacterized protein n=1 Tax=Phycomyces blakesleeanus (strain ATCC 8743b / DSM 1359 / FGSC 10004 / NBRC 33097 / NRRL 1555) TaxID=763407 RepID=A0A167MG46_PHYB8|nr:hypothetical protein PHYBLDRAFT_65322 [Phycomyces blakesleeanus NRRL 1555(-)]OAD72754.1 hypothetical protein PHYBLDRAFT_65322 [Phycomyces blakesleeanus NRRL 1555(-)]|eukprot:XP_018290794.1 hypothetical protein PHYBLDRAFT_65322 [Phycomyces blakesleeanus NRRL 1555(-)]
MGSFECKAYSRTNKVSLYVFHSNISNVCIKYDLDFNRFNRIFKIQIFYKYIYIYRCVNESLHPQDNGDTLLSIKVKDRKRGINEKRPLESPLKTSLISPFFSRNHRSDQTAPMVSAGVVLRGTVLSPD